MFYQSLKIIRKNEKDKIHTIKDLRLRYASIIYELLFL